MSTAVKISREAQKTMQALRKMNPDPSDREWVEMALHHLFRQLRQDAVAAAVADEPDHNDSDPPGTWTTCNNQCGHTDQFAGDTCPGCGGPGLI